MLPVIWGTQSALNQIAIYSIVLIMLSLSYCFVGGGLLYLGIAIALGVYFAIKVFRAYKERNHKAYWSVFGSSIIYLFGLFLAMIFDKFIADGF